MPGTARSGAVAPWRVFLKEDSTRKKLANEVEAKFMNDEVAAMARRPLSIESINELQREGSSASTTFKEPPLASRVFKWLGSTVRPTGEVECTEDGFCCVHTDSAVDKLIYWRRERAERFGPWFAFIGLSPQHFSELIETIEAGLTGKEIPAYFSRLLRTLSKLFRQLSPLQGVDETATATKSRTGTTGLYLPSQVFIEFFAHVITLLYPGAKRDFVLYCLREDIRNQLKSYKVRARTNESLSGISQLVANSVDRRAGNSDYLCPEHVFMRYFLLLMEPWCLDLADAFSLLDRVVVPNVVAPPSSSVSQPPPSSFAGSQRAAWPSSNSNSSIHSLPNILPGDITPSRSEMGRQPQQSPRSSTTLPRDVSPGGGPTSFLPPVC